MNYKQLYWLPNHKQKYFFTTEVSLGKFLLRKIQLSFCQEIKCCIWCVVKSQQSTFQSGWVIGTLTTGFRYKTKSKCQTFLGPALLQMVLLGHPTCWKFRTAITLQSPTNHQVKTSYGLFIVAIFEPIHQLTCHLLWFMCSLHVQSQHFLPRTSVLSI